MRESRGSGRPGLARPRPERGTPAADGPVPRSRRAARLHPGAWWLWALALGTAATRTTNPLLLTLLITVSGYVVAVRRPHTPWALSYGAFVKLAAAVLLLRLAFAVVLGSPIPGTHTLFTLPEVPLPDWAQGIRLGGRVTAEGLAFALYDALRLAALLICVGAANALASPSRLLKSLPGALYELGVAVVVALTFAPNLIADVRRLRAARPAARPPRQGRARSGAGRTAGAGRRVGAFGVPGRRDGRARVRPYRRGAARRAAHDGRPHARRAAGRVRGHVRAAHRRGRQLRTARAARRGGVGAGRPVAGRAAYPAHPLPPGPVGRPRLAGHRVRRGRGGAPDPGRLAGPRGAASRCGPRAEPPTLPLWPAAAVLIGLLPAFVTPAPEAVRDTREEPTP